MEMGTSYLSNKIYIGNTKTDKLGNKIWTKKTDVTDMAIKAVFEYMYIMAEETGGYQISIDTLGKMTFHRDIEVPADRESLQVQELKTEINRLNKVSQALMKCIKEQADMLGTAKEEDGKHTLTVDHKTLVKIKNKLEEMIA